MGVDEIKNKKLIFKENKIKKGYKRFTILISVLYFVLLLLYSVNDDVGVLLITVVFYTFINILIRNIFYVDVNKKELSDLDKKLEINSKKLNDFNDLVLMAFAFVAAFKKMFGCNIINVIFNYFECNYFECNYLAIDFLFRFILLCITLLIIMCIFKKTVLRDENSYWYDKEYVQKLEKKRKEEKSS